MVFEENQPLEQADLKRVVGPPRHALLKTSLLVAVVATLSFWGGYLRGNSQISPRQTAASDSQGLPAEATAQVTPVRLQNDVLMDNDPFLGPADAPITIVEFSDYQCPFCKRFRDQTLDQLLNAYPGQIRFVYRDFPLSNLHPRAQIAAEVAACAGDQGRYWEMHDLLFDNQAAWAGANNGMSYFSRFAEGLALDLNIFADCVKTGKYTGEVQQDLQDGVDRGVQGTPSFFVNGKFISGAVPFQMFQSIIERQLFDFSGASSN